jgi:hypothetical protein
MLKCARNKQGLIRITHSLIFLAAAALLLVLPLTTAAQTFRGTILGSVTDQTGAVVAGAKVTVRNVDTGLVRTTTTATDGTYAAPELPIGNYSVTVEKEGFQTAVTTGVRVEVAGDRRVDVSLKPGDVAQRIEVSGEGVVSVETTSNVLGGAFESKTVLDLPINGRDFTKLLIMVPGAAGEPNGGGDSPGSYGLFSVNGNRGRSNNFLLDGTDMNDGFRNLPAINQGGVFGTPGTVLPIEAIAEVRILSNFEAEFGRNSGSVVNIVTKSGTNEFHGSVFEYFRHDHLNARNFFNTKPNPKDKFRNNQFGAAVGGPIRKDSVFFYAVYEGQRERVGITSLNSVPDLAAYQAAVTTLGGNPAACNTSIIACINGQAAGVINPVIRNLYTRCDAQGGCSGNRDVWPTSFVSSAPAFNDADSFILKLDGRLSESQQLSGRYFFSDTEQSFPLGTGGGNILPNTNTFSPIRTQLISVSHVWSLSPTQVNEARFGWVLYQQDFLAGDRAVFGNPNTSLMLNTGVTREQDFGLPTIRVSGLAALGSAPYANPRGRDDTNWHFIDNFNWKLNRHEVKFGYEFRRTHIDSFYDTNVRGVLNFDSLADFLGGNPSGGRIAATTGTTDRTTTQNSHAFYFQDSFRWSSNLTVNLGLRWDYYGVIKEDQNRFSVYNPASGLALVEDVYDSDWNNFSPRVSVAWDPWGKGKTVFRAGAGMAYDAFSHDFFIGQIPFNCFNCPGVAYNPVGPDPLFLSLSFNPAIVDPMTGVATIQAGVPVFDPAQLTAGSTDSTDIFVAHPRIRTPYIFNYNLNVQQDLWGKGVLQVGYVGSLGRKLFRYRDINQPSAADITASDIACAGSGNPLGGCTGVSRPFDSGANLSTAAPTTPFYVNQLESSALSNYNGLQTSFTQRNWRGLTQQISWTWSHAIDDASDGQDFVPNAGQPNDSTNPRGERANANFDTRHRFVWSATYDFPKCEPLGWFGEGWQVGGVLTLMSGHPFHPNINFVDDYDGSGEFFGRPDVVATPSTNRDDVLNFLNLSAFAVPCTLSGGTFADSCLAGSRHFGTLGRNSILGPDYRNFDFSVSKNTNLTERFKLHFRADFFNLTNHPNFASPLLPAFIAPLDNVSDGSVGNPPLGRFTGFLPIVATSDTGLGNPILGGGGPRSVQFAVKLIF